MSETCCYKQQKTKGVEDSKRPPNIAPIVISSLFGSHWRW